MAAPSHIAHQLTETEAPTSVRPRRLRLLVIDDEVAICRSLQRLLAKDYEVTVECDARRGAALAAAGTWDVVFCDLMMPGMTGMDVYDSLASSRPDVARRMVFMTAGSFSARSWEFLESTENLHLTKPFDPATLRHAVGEVIARAAEVQKERA